MPLGEVRWGEVGQGRVGSGFSSDGLRFGSIPNTNAVMVWSGSIRQGRVGWWFGKVRLGGVWI